MLLVLGDGDGVRSGGVVSFVEMGDVSLNWLSGGEVDVTRSGLGCEDVRFA